MTDTSTILSGAVLNWNRCWAEADRTSPESVAALGLAAQDLVDAISAHLDEIAGHELREVWPDGPVIYSEPEPARPVTGRLYAGAGTSRVALGPALSFPAA